MSIQRITFALAVSLVALVLNVATASAQNYRRLDDLATRLQNQSQGLQQDFRSSLRYSMSYNSLRSDTSTLAYKARQVHEVARRGGNIQRLKSDLGSINRTFYRMEGLFNRVEHDAPRESRDQLHRLVAEMKQTIYQMQSEVDAMHAPSRATPNRGYSRYNNQTSRGYNQTSRGYNQTSRGHNQNSRGYNQAPVNIQGNGWGVSFGNGNVQFRVN